MTIDPAGQSHHLPFNANSPTFPISASNIGNVYSIAAGQILTIVPSSMTARRIWLFNVGSIPVAISSSQKQFPDGWHLPSGDVLELVTNSTIYASTVRFDFFDFLGNALISPLGYVSTAIEDQPSQT